MGKIIKSIKFILCAFILLMPFSIKASTIKSNEVRIEQARIYMPDIKVYFYPSDNDEGLSNITAALNNEKLSVIDLHAYEEDKAGTDYYLLLDISKSISKEYFSGIKQAVLEFKRNLKSLDTMTVLTFGDQVNVILDRISTENDISGTIENLDNNNDNTHLFEALDKTSELANKEEWLNKRAVAIVITDGEDCSTNENTKNEALEKLQTAGIPLYSMAVRETASGAANIFIEDFSDFTRAAQGKLFIFGKDEAVSCIQQIFSMLDSVHVLELKASSNRLQSVMQPLTLNIPGSGSKSLQVCPRYSQKDETPPTVKIRQNTDKQLIVAYSEPVLHAEELSNYKVTRDDEILPVYTLNYDANKNRVILVFSDSLKDGEYTIEFQNITDNSMNENKLETDAKLTIKKKENADTGNGLLLPAICVFVVLLLIILVVFFVVWRKKKGKKTSTDSLLLENTLNFAVRDENGTKDIKTVIHDKVVVGRSSECEISLIDELLSRKHFSIEKDNGDYYISNLSVTNGTKVNGIKLSSRCKLKNGDVIQAGSLYITISW